MEGIAFAVARLSSTAATGAPFPRIDCAALVFPLLLPQGRHQSKQRERTTTSVVLFFFLLCGVYVNKFPHPA